MVEVVDNTAECQFEARDEDIVVGVIKYIREDDTVTFTHTLVPTEYEGRGIGSALAKFALQHARQAHDQVVPRCPFVQAYLQRHPEERDLIAPDWNNES